MKDNIRFLKLEQANKLVYSSYGMTLNEKRLLNLAICLISPDCHNLPIMKIKVSDLKNYLDLKGRSLDTDIKDVCKKLLKRVVEIEDVSGNWIAHQWVSSCEIIRSAGELQIQLHNKLEPYLISLKKHYQSIKFEYISNIKKSHAIRVFEILWHKRKESGLPKNKIYIPFDELRKMLALETSYPRFVDFRIRVLDPAQKEIEKSTPIKFNYKIKKQERKVIAIEFDVVENFRSVCHIQLSEILGEKGIANCMSLLKRISYNFE